MKRIIMAGVGLALVVPATALAQTPTKAHARQYLRLYHIERSRHGAKAVGCELVVNRSVRHGRCHIRATDAVVVKSLGVLYRLDAPPPVVVTTTVPAGVPIASSTYVAPGTTYTSTAPTSGGLVGCIIKAESGGSPTVMNSSGHGGIAGWSQSTWQQDVNAEGKAGYPSSPTAATYSQQLSVLQGEGSTPQGFGQQTNFDPC